MRIAIYSRGLESEQLEGLKVLLKEFSTYNIEPVIYQDFLINFILQFILPINIPLLIVQRTWTK